MTVTHLEGKGFRNLLDFSLSFGQGVNILYGDNAQGKTNLLEALWMFTGSRSFRGAKDAELIRFEEKKASLTLQFKAQGRDQEAQLQIGDGKQALLNGVGPSPVSVLNGQFCAVVFAPGHLSLVKEGPEGRRRFLDQAICQVWPKYASLLGEYHRCLHQRNMLLKDVAFHSQLLDTLDIWEHFLSSYGGQICSIRMRYLERLAPTAAALYGEMSGDKEALYIAYHYFNPRTSSEVRRQNQTKIIADLVDLNRILRQKKNNIKRVYISLGKKDGYHPLIWCERLGNFLIAYLSHQR